MAVSRIAVIPTGGFCLSVFPLYAPFENSSLSSPVNLAEIYNSKTLFTQSLGVAAGVIASSPEPLAFWVDIAPQEPTDRRARSLSARIN